MKAFKATYEYGPHMGCSIYVLEEDRIKAKTLVRAYLIEESLWDRVGMNNLHLSEVSEIPAYNYFVY